MNELGAVSGLSQSGLYTQTIGHDEHGPVVFCKERTESLFNSGEITKEQYDKAMKQHEIHESKLEENGKADEKIEKAKKAAEEISKAEEKIKEAKKAAEEKSKTEEKEEKSLFEKTLVGRIVSWFKDGGFIDMFKIPEGKEKEAMNDAAVQWSYDNPI